MNCFDREHRRHLSSGAPVASRTSWGHSLKGTLVVQEALIPRTRRRSRAGPCGGPRRRRALVPARRRPNRAATTFLAASNTEPAFDFMTQDFIPTANGGQQRHLQLRRLREARRRDRRRRRLRVERHRERTRRLCPVRIGRRGERRQHDSRGRSRGEEQGGGARRTARASASTPHSATYSAANGGNSNGTSCPGIGSTRAQYTTGRLVIFSCRSGGTHTRSGAGCSHVRRARGWVFHQERGDRGAVHHGPGVD